MSQKMHVSEVFSLPNYLLMHYGQIVAFLFALGIISYLYVAMQKIVINYIDNLALGQLPNF
jgi:hypothetical protein